MQVSLCVLKGFSENQVGDSVLYFDLEHHFRTN